MDSQKGEEMNGIYSLVRFIALNYQNGKWKVNILFKDGSTKQEEFWDYEPANERLKQIKEGQNERANKKD